MSDPRRDLESEAEYGLITREMARRAGMSDAQIDRRVRRGQWVVWPGRGTYLIRSSMSDPLARLYAATRSLEGIAYGPSALALWGLGEFPDTPVLVRDRAFGGRAVRVIRTRRPPGLVVRRRRGISTVGLEEAVASVAGELDLIALDGLIDRVLGERLTTWDRLEPVLELHKGQGRSGSALLGRVLAERSSDSAVPLSDWSRRFARALEGEGLERPQMEWRVCHPGGSLAAQVDLAYPGLRYAIELDSVAYHLNREAFETDRRRDGTLARLGWLVRRFTWDQWSQEWELVVATIRADLARRPVVGNHDGLSTPKRVDNPSTVGREAG